eukprot:107032_1
MGNKVETLWKCDECKFVNKKGDLCKKCESQNVTIPIKVKRGPYSCTVKMTHGEMQSKQKYETKWQILNSIRTAYSCSIKMDDIFNKIIDIVNNKYYPKIYFIDGVDQESFLGTDA